MKSVKEQATETKILNRLKDRPVCLELVNYLFNDEELQEIQEYANNVSIKRLGYNDHGPVHMRQVVYNAIKMLNILHDFGIKTSLEQIACTKAWGVCKNQAFSPQFLIMRDFPKAAKRPLFVPDCIVSVNFFLFERF